MIGKMDQAEAENLRILACDIVQNAGILLKLPQVVMATAQMLLQRVYHTAEYTFDKYHIDITSMAALFLASKIEEYPRKAREVIDVFTYVISRKLKCEIELRYQEHERVREDLITAERRLLKTLGFNLLSSYPHKIIITYYNAIVFKLDPERNVWREHVNQRILQRAWNYCNDSLRLDVYLRFTKEAVAFACIQMACEDLQMTFPKSTDGREWYCLFVADDSEVKKSIDMIRSFYKRDKLVASYYRKYIHLVRFQRVSTNQRSK